MVIRTIKLFFLILLPVVLFMAIWAGYSWLLLQQSDIKNILQDSVLNGRTFSAQVKEIYSPSGIKAYFMEEKNSPLISISFKFQKTGLAYETKKFGTVNFLSDMLTEGTTTKSPEKYDEYLRKNGIKISFSADYDDFNAQFTFPVENTKKALSILKDTLYHPLFAKKEMDILKDRYEVAFALQDENEKEIFSKLTRPLIYNNHQYARNPLGNIEAIRTLKAEDLREFMKDNFARSNLLVSIAGGVTEDKAKEIIGELFSDLPLEAKINDINQFQRESFELINESKHDFAQNRIMFVGKGVYRNEEDFYPLYIANYIFGGSGLGSRLNDELRVKEGLTYGAYSWMQIRDKSALLISSFTTSPDNYERAKEIALEEWKKFGRDGAKKEEFEKTKKYLIDSFNLRFDSTIEIASMLTEIQKYNLGTDFLQNRNDYIRNVDFKAVNDAAKRYFTNDIMIIGAGQLKNE